MTTEKEGTLQMQPTGRWAIVRPGQSPVEITSGEVFRVEVAGAEAGRGPLEIDALRADGGPGITVLEEVESRGRCPWRLPYNFHGPALRSTQAS
jgi:hypothetical protein